MFLSLFSARFLCPHSQYNGGFRTSSKPVAKVAVLCSPYEGGMPRTCTNMNPLPVTFSWSGTVFSFIPEAFIPLDPLSGSVVMELTVVCIGGAFFVC